MNRLIDTRNEEYLLIKQNPHFEEIECKFCHRLFLRRNKKCKSNSSLPCGVRGKNCVTCCHECSKLNAGKKT